MTYNTKQGEYFKGVLKGSLKRKIEKKKRNRNNLVFC